MSPKAAELPSNGLWAMPLECPASPLSPCLQPLLPYGSWCLSRLLRMTIFLAVNRPLISRFSSIPFCSSHLVNGLYILFFTPMPQSSSPPDRLECPSTCFPWILSSYLAPVALLNLLKGTFDQGTLFFKISNVFHSLWNQY